jgi:protein disulfide-isomerase A6
MALDFVRQVFAEVDKTAAKGEIPELTSADVMEANCSGEDHICILAALPHISESGAARRNKYKDLLSTVSKTFRASSVSFLWFEGPSQPELEKSLGYVAVFPVSFCPC